MKPRVFIGSSREYISHAFAIQENLDRDFECKVWDQDVFKASRYPLPSLAEELSRSDFGVFVFTADDVTRTRGKQVYVPRDNVVFEAGFFGGALGYENVFILVPRGYSKMHLPSDLQALTVLEYTAERSDNNLNAAVGSCCSKIRREIAERWPVRAKQRMGIAKSGAFGDFDERAKVLFKHVKDLTLYFIHSRRWRETNNSELREFLGRQGTTLTVYLPDITNKDLVRSIMGHFDDGPHIPGLIEDAYDFFISLDREFNRRVNVKLYQTYPSYSFYKFDDLFIVAFYPTTPLRRPVPTFEVAGGSWFGEFIGEDLRQLEMTSRVLDSAVLRTRSAAKKMYGVMVKAKSVENGRR